MILALVMGRLLQKKKSHGQVKPPDGQAAEPNNNTSCLENDGPTENTNLSRENLWPFILDQVHRMTGTCWSST